MVASYWLQTQTTPTTSLFPRKIPITSSYEWEMNNDFPFQTQKLQEEKKEENGNDKPRREWDLSLTSIVSSSCVGTCSDTLGAIEFDPSGNFLATAGISRKIRIYKSDKLLPDHNFSNVVSRLDHATTCEYYISTPAKLSSLKWKPGSGHVIGSGDYDGVIMEYDLENKIPIFERDEHGGRRVWTVDYSTWHPIGASGSDDGTVQIWDTRMDGGDCSTWQPSRSRSSVCCVEFDNFGGSMIAVGCADKKAYGYDVRKIGEPVMVLNGHTKTISYLKFIDNRTVVTAGTDGCLMLWDTQDQSLVRVFKGHVNNKRFVGLSVLINSGLLCCGSESNEVYVYDKRWGEPLWAHGFEPVGWAELEMGRAGLDSGFVSGVCWRQLGEDCCTLVAGGSDGVLQVFKGKRSLQ